MKELKNRIIDALQARSDNASRNYTSRNQNGFFEFREENIIRVKCYETAILDITAIFEEFEK